MNTPSAIQLSSLDQANCQQELSEIIARFSLISRSRLQRIQGSLLTEQSVFLDLLPLLFHQNNPLLPGFSSDTTIAGLCNYQPSEKTLAQAQALAADFTYQENKQSVPPIEGIYLMGSVSSIAFANHSDIDIWLCYTHNLLPAEITELQTKATAIEDWTDSLGLEVHFYLVDNQVYLTGHSSVSTSDNRQVQNYLLLEEFYRTTIFIAGRTPMWWLVPPHEEKNYRHYVQQLKQKRLIAEEKLIDFGGLADIPAEEFVTTTLWQLYKSLNSPYKTLLKLFLMECYSNEYPNPEWVSLKIKESVYKGELDIDSLDPYVLLFHKIEKYLSAENEPERLNFARQCFYLKIMGDMEMQTNSQKLSYRQAIINRMAEQHRWPTGMLKHLAKSNLWDTQKASQENERVMQQLKMCYKMISLFSNANTSTSQNHEIRPIGRKLKFFLQKRPGKIDIITTRSSIRKKESTLTLVESSARSIRPTWDLFLGDPPLQNTKPETAFKQRARSLVELLAWLVSNDLYHPSLKLNIYANDHLASNDDISHALTSLRSFLFNRKLGNLTELQAFREPSRIIAHLLLVNLDDSPPLHIAEDMLVFNNYSDILSYGSQKESFVHTIDQVSISSWGEVTCKRFLHLEGLFECFITCFNQHSQSLPTRIECYTPTHGASIAAGVKNFFIKLSDLFAQQQNQGSSRLVIAGESDFYIFQQKNSFLHYKKAENLATLLLELAAAQISVNTVYFNNSTLSKTPLPFIYSYAKPNIINVFCYSHNSHIVLYIIDEKGSLFSQSYHNTSTQQLLTSYANFLETLYDKGILESVRIEYYELFSNADDQYRVIKITPPPAFVWDYLNIRITGEIYGSPPEILYSLYCNELEFSAAESNEDVFQAVTSYIYNMRQSKEKYPIHITEIDVPLQALGVNNYQQLQSIHFLQYKQKIEACLNTELG